MKQHGMLVIKMNELKHFNPNHGKDGRFTFGSTAPIIINKSGKKFYKIPYKTIDVNKKIINVKIPFTKTNININKSHKDKEYLNIRVDLVRDSKLKVGSVVYRYSSKHEKIKNTPTYVINNKNDLKKYGDYIDQLDGYKKSKYLHTMVIKKEVNIPSYIKQIDTFKDVMRDKKYKQLYLNVYRYIT